MSNKELIIKVLTEEPQKQVDISKKLNDLGINIEPRILRKYFRQINNDFIHGRIDYVIVSNRLGTYKSKSAEDIRKFNDNKIKHAKSELWSAYNINKRIEKNKNLSFIDYINEQMKGEINA